MWMQLRSKKALHPTHPNPPLPFSLFSPAGRFGLDEPPHQIQGCFLPSY